VHGRVRCGNPASDPLGGLSSPTGSTGIPSVRIEPGPPFRPGLPCLLRHDTGRGICARWKSAGPCARWCFWRFGLLERRQKDQDAKAKPHSLQTTSVIVLVNVCRRQSPSMRRRLVIAFALAVGAAAAQHDAWAAISHQIPSCAVSVPSSFQLRCDPSPPPQALTQDSYHA